MSTTKANPCLIGQQHCGMTAGKTSCTKCGMDRNVVYAGKADLESAQARALASFWENHAKQLEGELKRAKGVPSTKPAKVETKLSQSGQPPEATSKLNPQAAWPFPTSSKP